MLYHFPCVGYGVKFKDHLIAVAFCKSRVNCTVWTSSNFFVTLLCSFLAKAKVVKTSVASPTQRRKIDAKKSGQSDFFCTFRREEK